MFADFFVDYKEGLRGWFVISCLIAGAFIGFVNYYLLNLILISKLKRITEAAARAKEEAVKGNNVVTQTVSSIKNLAQTNESVNHATAAGNSLQQITQTVEGITEINSLINDEAGAQSGVAMEINQNMHTIGEIATESMNGAERTNQESQKLSNLAENLQQLVAKFKL